MCFLGRIRPRYDGTPLEDSPGIFGCLFDILQPIRPAYDFRRPPAPEVSSGTRTSVSH
jgi:hypothetical protein